MEVAVLDGNTRKHQDMVNELLKHIFFDFTFWHDLKIRHRQCTYFVMIREDMVISSASCYRTTILYGGKPYAAVSIGGVATSPEFRNQWYSQAIFHQIFERYQTIPLYLSANKEAAGFTLSWASGRRRARRRFWSKALQTDARQLSSIMQTLWSKPILSTIKINQGYWIWPKPGI